MDVSTDVTVMENPPAQEGLSGPARQKTPRGEDYPGAVKKGMEY